MVGDYLARSWLLPRSGRRRGASVLSAGPKAKIVEPGVIRTDFSGRSFDVANDESMEEYQELVGKIFGALETMVEGGAEASVVAEVIYEAATDGSDKLRYTAGYDAARLMAARSSMSDEEFTAGIKAQLGL